MRALIELARQLGERHSLDRMLTIVVTQASRELGCKHVSLRLLDASRKRLLVTARAAREIHTRGDVTFAIGEGLVGWVAQHAQPVRTGRAMKDDRFVVRPDSTRQFESFLAVPLIASGVCIGVLTATDHEPDRFSAHDEDVLTLVAAICTPHLEAARLARLASHDSLTGVLNRVGLDETLLGDRPVAPPFALAMVDIDRFKRVNDTHGHAVGDEVLRHVAAILADGLRATDGVVRWGGEEFLVVLPGVAPPEARAIVERSWARLRMDPVRTSAGEIPVTFSVGLASLRDGEAFPALVERADRALYRAKNGGRDRIEIED
jgi:diguanylate cyclase (GGDEF)-like protein